MSTECLSIYIKQGISPQISASSTNIIWTTYLPHPYLCLNVIRNSQSNRFPSMVNSPVSRQLVSSQSSSRVAFFRGAPEFLRGFGSLVSFELPNKGLLILLYSGPHRCQLGCVIRDVIKVNVFGGCLLYNEINPSLKGPYPVTNSSMVSHHKHS